MWLSTSYYPTYSAKGSFTYRAKGFTLVEILLVVVIIGVMAGLALLALGGNESRLLQLEASRLQQRLLLAQDEAGFRQQNLGLQIDSDGYEFLQYDEDNDQWLPLQDPKLSQHQFELPVNLRLELEGSPLLIAPNREESPGGASQAGIGDQATQPNILLLASGENSAFSLVLSLKDDGSRQSNGQHPTQVLSSDGFSPITRVSQVGP